MRTKLIVRALVVKEDLALVNVTRKGPRLLGGGVKKDETLQEALRRELLEEIGCGAIIGDQVNVIERLKRRTREVTFVFKASVTGEPVANEKGIRLAWVPRVQVCGYSRTIPYQAA